MSTGNEEAVREHFKEQAQHFGDKSLTLNNADYLKWIVESFVLHKEMEVLDVAAGTGILSRALSSHVAKVTAVDLSDDMIREGLRQLQLQGISNVEYKQGHVERLPVDLEHYNLVVSRLAFHHFTNPGKVLSEMVRVCRRDGLVSVVDMISPEDEVLCQAYNHYERLRDPSHTEALSRTQLLRLSSEAGIHVTSVDTINVPVQVDKWLRMTKTEASVEKRILDALEEEVLSGIHCTGMFPYRNEAGELMFRQTWIKIIGCKRTEG